MARDNLSMLFSNAAVAPTSTSASSFNSSNASTEAVANFSRSSGDCNNNGNMKKPAVQTDILSMPNSDRGHNMEDESPSITPTTTNDTYKSNIHSRSQRPPSTAGTESIQYLRKFVSPIGSMALLKPLRELQLAEKLNSMNAEIEHMQGEKEVERQRRQLEEQDRAEQHYDRAHQREDGLMYDEPEQLARELQGKEEEGECERIKIEADAACKRVAGRYDALVKFTSSCPRGNYEEFVEFLLMGGGSGGSDNNDGGLGEDYDSLMFENFHDKNSGESDIPTYQCMIAFILWYHTAHLLSNLNICVEYRKLWNDNLTMGLPDTSRAFVPAVVGSSNTSGGDTTFDPWHSLSTEGSTSITNHK